MQSDYLLYRSLSLISIRSIRNEHPIHAESQNMAGLLNCRYGHERQWRYISNAMLTLKATIHAIPCPRYNCLPTWMLMR
jgi:hypothetical protein